MKHSRDEDIASLTARRDAARKAKNWALADSLRDELNSRGVQLQDRSVASSSLPGSVVIDREKEEAKRRKKKAKKERKMLAAHEAHMQRRTAADDDAAEPDGGGAGEGGEVQEQVLAKNVRVLRADGLEGRHAPILAHWAVLAAVRAHAGSGACAALQQLSPRGRADRGARDRPLGQGGQESVRGAMGAAI